MFDVAVIGGGVIGGAILRELTKYDLRVALVEKESDVCMGASRANSGIVHAGFDAKSGTRKAKYNVLGNRMMAQYAADLGVKFKPVGALVLAFHDDDLAVLAELRARGAANGVTTEIVDANAVRRLEPNVSDSVVGALYAPTSGIVCPYELTIAAIGNAMDNGATLLTDFEVTAAVQRGDAFTLTARDGRTVESRLVVNCAGAGSGKIAALLGDDSFTVGFRRGEYILLDRESGDFVSHTLFCTPTAKGKGILVTPTVDGNILLGPTAEDGASTVDTTAAGLQAVTEKAKTICKNVPFYNTITSFAGVRVYSDRHDFVVEESAAVEGLIHCAGIESPGLTSAPAIAVDVVERLVGAKIDLKPNKKFDGKREPDCFFKNLSVEEQNKRIRRDPRYGKIVCRCEQITEGEIVRAVHANPKATTVDAVKRRTRAGMGRCQGGFCQPSVAEIIARELNIPFEQVTKSGAGSSLVTGRTK